MRRARLSSPEGPRECVERGGRWVEVTDYLGEGVAETGWGLATGEATLLASVIPTVIVGLGANSRPADENGPQKYWLKSPRTVIDPGAGIPWGPGPDAGRLVAEGELAVVIGRAVDGPLDEEGARAAILGWTLANDLTAADLITEPNYLGRAKNGAGFTPIGPWITHLGGDDDLPIEVDVNGAERCRSTTARLVQRSVSLLREISAFTPLGVGDVILTGSPETATEVVVGDVVDIRIPGLGQLSNPVVAG